MAGRGKNISNVRVERLETDARVIDRWDFGPDDAIQIGRHRDNDIIVSHKKVSRYHAMLFVEGGHWRCTCIGKNGMFVNGQRRPEAIIEDGIEISFADNEIVFRFHFPHSGPDPDSIRGSITQLIDAMGDGDIDALNNLWQRCLVEVVKVARARLGKASKDVSGDEVASSVFELLYLSSAEGALPELKDRNSLWRMLVSITLRRADAEVRRRRDESQRSLETTQKAPTRDDEFDELVKEMPQPDFMELVEEETQFRIDLLPDDTHRHVALLRLEGFENDEVATMCKRSVHTIERQVNTIRRIWSRDQLDSKGRSNDDTTVD